MQPLRKKKSCNIYIYIYTYIKTKKYEDFIYLMKKNHTTSFKRPPYKSVQKSQYQYKSTRGTLADEALSYSTIYPTSCDFGTTEFVFGTLP